MEDPNVIRSNTEETQPNEAYNAWTNMDNNEHAIVEKKEYQGGVPAICTYDGDRLVKILYYQYDDDEFDSQPAADVWYDNSDLYRLASYIDMSLRDNAEPNRSTTNNLYEDLTQEQIDYVVEGIKDIAKQDKYFDEEESFQAIDDILSFDHNMAIHSFLEGIHNGIKTDSNN